MPERTNDIVDFNELLTGLRNHTRPDETLNRLFRKHLDGRKPKIACFPPYLKKSNTIVTKVSRPKQEILKLASNLTDLRESDSKKPVTIVRYRGEECLLDGNSRCRYWHRNPNLALGEHDVYLIELIDDA